jgi:nitroreductase
VDWIVLDDPDRIAKLSREVVAILRRTARLLQKRVLRPFLYLALGKRRVDKARESTEDIERLTEQQERGEDPIFYDAPAVLIAHVPKGSYFGRSDAVYAAYNVMLAAERLGLGTCHIGFFNVARERNQELPRMVGLPPDRQVEVVLALGYPRFRYHRVPPRRRRELVWNPESS